MPEQPYLVAVDPTVDVVALKDVVKHGDGFSHWWNHIPGAFPVTSRLAADEIADRLRPITGDSRVLVMAVHLEDSEGWVPQESWKWIKRRTRELRTLRPREAAVSHASSDGA